MPERETSKKKKNIKTSEEWRRILTLVTRRARSGLS
jgi:hypothetical protein